MRMPARYIGDAPQILACARHMGAEHAASRKKRKKSLQEEAAIAGMSSAYLEKVLEAGLTQLALI